MNNIQSSDFTSVLFMGHVSEFYLYLKVSNLEFSVRESGKRMASKIPVVFLCGSFIFSH